MGQFNTKLVESLDFLNKIIALIFVILAVYKLYDLLGDGIINALFESLTILGAGVLTCGYIALMLNINNLLTEINERNKD